MKQQVCATWPNCTGLGDAQHCIVHHTNYDAVMPYLDGDAFTDVLVDLRGYGSSVGMRGCYTVEEIAADCLPNAGMPYFATAVENFLRRTAQDDKD